MPSLMPESFEREQGFTEAEWERCLPGAVGEHAWRTTGPGSIEVSIGAGTMHLTWKALPPRRIALIAMPRLAVRYRFENVDAESRQAFMRYFDLYTQRGGG
jgi:hypothetical protein